MRFPKSIIPALMLALFITSCKKEDFTAENNLNPVPVENTSAADKLKDSALLYARDIYLWHNKIPADFNARSFDDPAAIMTAIRKYAIEPGFTSSVDRWSFAVGQQEWNKVSSGQSADFGLNIFFRQEGDLRVRSVEKHSPAGLAGIKRGWRIMKINGNENMATTNANFIVQNVYQSGSTAFTFQKPDGSTVNLTLASSSYQESPVVLDSVYAVNGKKIGYFVLGSFLGDTSSIYNSFSRIFNRFAGEGVQDVVVDLRYNGGGYVSVAEKLANYLAPAAASGNVMMTQKFNDKYASFNNTEKFSKAGSLSLGRIFFIVGNGTASASELLINSLKPYMDVMLVGPAKTHGKPVGYFPIPVGNWYVFPVSFFTVNKNGEGHYFNGMSLDFQVADGLDKDWGELSESAFGSAVNYITTGSYRSAAAGQTRTYQQSAAVISGNQALDVHQFKGAIDVRGLK